MKEKDWILILGDNPLIATLEPLGLFKKKMAKLTTLSQKMKIS